MPNPFDFLEPLVEIENKINDLQGLSTSQGLDLAKEIRSLQDRLEVETRRIFAGLTPWQRVALARHPDRPQTSDFIDHMIDEFVPLAGDRAFADDEAILCGLGRLGDTACLIMGHQKGRDLNERLRCNFGMPNPEGYRKAMKKMQLAEKFRLPVINLINTPGAACTIGGEERGQSIAIAENLRDMAVLRTPIVGAVIGEGGSGGALAIGVVDRLLVLENSYYSVITPEGCASILFKNANQAAHAAASMRVDARSLFEMGIADEVVPEPAGGAHRHPKAMAELLKPVLLRHLGQLQQLTVEELLEQRYAKYRRIGVFTGG